MKNIIKKTSIVLLLFVSFYAFSQNLRTAESYINAVTFTDQATSLQNQGRYDDSIDKSKEANSAIDTALMDALHLLMKTKADIAKTNAEAQIKAANTSGAAKDAAFKPSLDKAQKSFEQGNTLLVSAPNERTADDKVKEGYNAAISSYNEAEAAAKQANEAFLAKKRAESDKSITAAQAQYDDLLKKNAFAKNDANDKKISAAIAAAQKALTEDNFDAVQSNIKTASDTLSGIEKTFVAEQTKTKKSLDDAQKQYNQLKSDKILTANSADDKSASKQLSDATTAYNAGDFKKAQTSLAEASKIMANAEKTFKTAQADAKKVVDDATAKQKQMNTAKTLASGSAEDKNISKLIADANTAFKANDFAKAKDSANKAQTALAAAEKTYADAEKKAQALLTQATAKQKALVDAKLLTADSAEGKALAKLIADANTALKAKDLTAVEKNSNDALAMMKKIEDKGPVVKSLAEAKERYLALLSTFAVPVDNADSAAIGALLIDADKSLAGGDLVQTDKLIKNAIAKMDKLEGELKAAKESEAKKTAELSEQTTAEEAARIAAEAQAAAKKAAEGAKAATDVVLVENTTKTDGAADKPAETKPAASTETATAENTLKDADGLPVDEKGRVTVLPKYYVVVKREPLTDCLWRISGYSYIYNDVYEWKRIYELNKKTFVKSDNPNLILPGQILEIPALKGETRDGTYNPKKTYVPITK